MGYFRLANFGTFVALASYSRQKAASPKRFGGRGSFDYNVKFGALTQTLLSMGLTIYMWYAAIQSGTTRISHIRHWQGNCKDLRKSAALLAVCKIHAFRDRGPSAWGRPDNWPFGHFHLDNNVLCDHTAGGAILLSQNSR